MNTIKNKILHIFMLIVGINSYNFIAAHGPLLKNPISIQNPEKALKELMDGNKIFIKQWNKKERKKVAIKQHPFAVVLSCSDSRVSPEIIFDELHLGSLFVVRNAGNVADDIVIGSIEYGIEHLHAVLIIVLGHERCGAVTAAVETLLAPQPESSINIKNIIDMIAPAVQSVMVNYKDIETISAEIKHNIISESIKENVRLTKLNLYKNSKIIQEAFDAKKINIIGAYYDLDDGIIQIIS